MEVDRHYIKNRATWETFFHSVVTIEYLQHFKIQAHLLIYNASSEFWIQQQNLTRLSCFCGNRRLESCKKRLDKDSLDKHSALNIDNYCHSLNNYSSGLGYHKFAVEMDPK